MPAKFITRLIGTATRYSFDLLDKLATIVSAFLPTIYSALGVPMPEDAVALAGVYLFYGILTFMAIRLITSPYLVWKEDQEAIRSLNERISNPKLKIKEAIEEKIAKDSVAVFSFLSSHRLGELIKDRSKTNIAEYTEFHGAAISLKASDKSFGPLLDELMDSHMKAVYWMRFNADGQTWKDESIDTLEEERKHCERYVAAKNAINDAILASGVNR